MKEICYSNAVLLPEIIKLINEGHTVTLRLKGYSMRPFLEDGRDKALLTLPKNPQVGDPVLAEISHGRYVLHRIVKIEGEQVTLLGDGNLVCEHCRLKDIKAGVVGFYRKGRDTLDPLTGRKWQLHSVLWTRLYPIRRYLLAAYRRIWMPIFGPI